jgi:hypothetical protein
MAENTERRLLRLGRSDIFLFCAVFVSVLPCACHHSRASAIEHAVVDFRSVNRQISAKGFAKSRAAEDFADDALFTGFSFIWTFGDDLERICWLCELNGIPQHRIRHEGHAIVLDQTCDRHGVHNIGRRLRARDIRRDGVRPLGVAAALGAGDDLEHFAIGIGVWPMDCQRDSAESRYRLHQLCAASRETSLAFPGSDSISISSISLRIRDSTGRLAVLSS